MSWNIDREAVLKQEWRAEFSASVIFLRLKKIKYSSKSKKLALYTYIDFLVETFKNKT